MSASHTEAPASWTVRYISPDGYDCMLTLRGESGADLLPRTLAALAWLADHGCQPSHSRAIASASTVRTVNAG